MDICQWFAMCANETSTVLLHPILGQVPCCTRCARVVGAEAQLIELEDSLA